MMRRSAGFDADPRRRQLLKEFNKLPSPQLLAQHRLLGRIHTMQLENTLGRVHSNADKIVHGRPPCLRSTTTSFWHIDAVGGRPPQQPPMLVMKGIAAPARINIGIGGYGSRIAFAALTCPGRRKLFSRREATEVCGWLFPYPRKRGCRECRMRAAPAVSCARCTKKCAHEHTGSAEAIRHSLRNGFTAYIALSPATNSSCHRHRRIKGLANPIGLTHLRRLD